MACSASPCRRNMAAPAWTSVAAGLVLQGFGRWNHAMALAWVAHDNLCLNNIYRNGDERAASQIPARSMLRPEDRRAWPDRARRWLRRARARCARPRGATDDHYVLNGSKIYITNGPVADVLLVYAKTEREKGAHGISAFIVEKDFPGFKVAQKLEKMGYRGSQTGELVFEDCRVPAENLVGAENRRRRRRDERSRSRTRDDLAALSRHRRARAGTLDRIREDAPAVRQADRLVPDGAVDAGGNVCPRRNHAHLHLPHARGRGAARRSGEGGRGDIHKLTAASVMYAADSCHAVLDKAMQIHGGSGYIWESEINRLYRSIKLLEIGAGTTEVRKMIISGELLKDMKRHD